MKKGCNLVCAETAGHTDPRMDDNRGRTVSPIIIFIGALRLIKCLYYIHTKFIVQSVHMRLRTTEGRFQVLWAQYGSTNPFITAAPPFPLSDNCGTSLPSITDFAVVPVSPYLTRLIHKQNKYRYL